MKTKPKSESPLIGERSAEELADEAFEEARAGNINYWTMEVTDPEIKYWKEIWIKGYKAGKAKEDSPPEATIDEFLQWYYGAPKPTGTMECEYDNLVNLLTTFKERVLKVESKEDNKAFGEQDLEDAFNAGQAYDYYVGLRTWHASAVKRPNFKEWFKARKSE